ncbi:IS701 family transposase [Dactylosporangium salmoneum]|uniref:IS701 family transposase n=1 Tax=Dactylosporangium salmoneum TaxID=53361 RepID=A0ABN3G1E9_9ACTN
MYGWLTLVVGLVGPCEVLVARLVCPPAAGPLEAYAALFDGLFSRLAQRRGFREYLSGLLAPRDRNKTLTGLAGTEPVVGAQHAAAQRLQYFLSESTWDAGAVNDRRLELLQADPATAWHGEGVLVIDDSGDRKAGRRTAHVGRQWLGRYGKTDNGVVTVTTLWADEQVYYPLHAQAYTPASHFSKGRTDPGFRTKPRIAGQLVAEADTAGVACRAVVADCGYGDHDELRGELQQGGWGFVLALKPARGAWQYGAEAYTPKDAGRAVPWNGPDDPGRWSRVQRRFRDGHTETWWAVDASLGWWGPDGQTRLVVATIDPATLPDKATWYLATNLPRPGGPHATSDSLHEAADLAEVVRLYGMRNWIEQSYKQVKDELGWADFQVRSAVAIGRHQNLVHCAFSFCWKAWFDHHPDQPSTLDTPSEPNADLSPDGPAERGPFNAPAGETPVLAQDPPRGPRLADPVATAATLVESLVRQAPTH